MKLALFSFYLAVEAKELRFNEQGKFKFVQFTDTHYGTEDGIGDNRD